MACRPNQFGDIAEYFYLDSFERLVLHENL
jgi:hypothetical protein